MATIKVNGMHCANCKKAVEDAVSKIDGIKSARVNLDAKELEYEAKDPAQPVDLDIIINTIEDLGFTPEVKS